MATEFISNSWLMPTNANAEANRVSNYSLDFDGSSQYISIDPILKNLPSDNFTISAWVKINTLPTGTAEKVIFQELTSSSRYVRLCIKGNQNGFVLRYGNGSNLQINGATTITTGVWYNIMLVYSTTGIKLYLNGSEDASASYTSLSRSAFQYAAIGCYYYAGSASNFWDGMITQFSLFDYELSSSQVTQLYGTGSAIGNPMAITNGRKPVAYYPLGNAGFNSEFLVPNGAEQDYVFSFDGINDYISTNLNVDNYTNLTYSVWVNPVSLNERGGICDLSSSDNFGAYFWAGSGGQFYVNIGSSFSNIVGTWSSGKFGTLGQEKWLHLAIVYDGSGSTDADRLKVYADGDYIAFNSVGSIPTSIPSGGGNLVIGKTNVYEFEGEMSNVSVFNTSLPETGAESVASLYNYGTPPNIASWSNLQGWWELDASATFDGLNWSIPDASSNSNTGTSSGMTAASLIQSDLIINQSYDPFSLDFDGSDDYIAVPNSSDFDFTTEQEITVSAWVKGGAGLTNTIAALWIGGANKMWWLFTDKVTINLGGANISTPAVTVSTNEWHHIAFTYSQADGELKHYVDTVASTTSNSGAMTYTSGITELRIGYLQGGTSRYMDGQISNVSIYNSKLTSAQIKTLYNEGKPFDLNTFEVTPVSWWRLGAVNSSFDGTNWTVLDEISTSGNNGVSANMTQSDLVDGVGATGSGTSSGMGSGENRIGSAPFSENNAVSYNMSVTAKSTSVPT